MLASLAEQLKAEITADGPLPFSRLVDRALYDAERGFYTTTGQAGGRRGDFVTSVEVGPLFAAVIAGWLDHVWLDAGKPDPFRVSEVGAGVGTLFRGVHRAQPACFDSLQYTLVERSAAMLVQHQSLPSEAWRSWPELPAMHQHAVLGNELLDNLVFDIAECVEGGWAPVHVVCVSDRLELAAAVEPEASLSHLSDLAPAATVGTRVPVATGGGAWVNDAIERCDWMLMFDYGASTAELGLRGQQGWLRTYASHARGNDPLVDIGRRDITHDVPFDQLPAPAVHMSQAAWLRAHGLDALVDAARATWNERKHIGDLQAMAARSAITEAEALTDADGLGSFSAIEWIP